ncbi:hypothetical protein MMPV_004126 [Pyropia vietnamensis]
MAKHAAFAVTAATPVAVRVSSSATCSFTARRVSPAAAQSTRVSSPWTMQEASTPAAAAESATTDAEPTSSTPALSEEATGAVAAAVADDDAAAKGTERRSLSKRRSKGGSGRGSPRVVTVQYSDLVEGAEYDGTVKAVMEYGCFVDIGSSTDGLVHVSKFGRGYVEKVSNVVSLGQSVRVAIESVDTEKKNFSLRMVVPAGKAGSEYDQRRGGSGGRSRGGGGGASDIGPALSKWYAEYGSDPSKMLTGKVSSVREFGAFVSLEGAPTDGLVHVSQIQEGRVPSVASALSVGQEVSVRVVECDAARKRLSLSMKPYVDAGETESGHGPSKAQIEGANASQPIFRTSFELAFEKAKSSKSS